jgi:hypothetical protein
MEYSHTHLKQRQRILFISKVTLSDGLLNHREQPDKINQSINQSILLASKGSALVRGTDYEPLPVRPGESQESPIQ